MTAIRHDRRRRLLTAAVCLGLLLLLPGCGMLQPVTDLARALTPRPHSPSVANGLGAADSLGQVVFVGPIDDPAPVAGGVVSVPVAND